MIDIIIPAYNSKWNIEATVASIVSQVIADKCKVTIVNDCSDYDYSYLIEQYENILDIQEFILSKNKGPGFARQYAIERTNNPYIVFIDSDDIFMNVFSLANLFEAISNNEKAAMIYASFLDEVSEGRYVQGKSIMFTFHGAIYRREFIEKNDVRFLESRANEDIGFNFQVLLKTDLNNEWVVDGINTYTYLRKFNKNSITASDPAKFHHLDGILGNVENRLFAFLKEDINNEMIIERGCASMADFYFYYLEMLEIKPEYKDEVLLALRKFYKLFGKHCLDNYSKDKLKDILLIKQKAFEEDGSIFNKKMEFDEFIELL